MKNNKLGISLFPLLTAAAVLTLSACSNGFNKYISNGIDATPQKSTANTDWPMHGNNRYEQRFSELTDINAKNISELGLAWYIDLPENRGQEATPLIINGVMYTTSAWNHVHALNAKTGEILWQYDPKVPKKQGIKGCCDSVTRGLAYDKGRVIQATLHYGKPAPSKTHSTTQSLVLLAWPGEKFISVMAEQNTGFEAISQPMI